MTVETKVQVFVLASEVHGLRVRIVDGRGKDKDYIVTRLRSDFGTAVRFLRAGMIPDQEPLWYDVLLGDESAACDCIGHGRWGRCKHFDAAEELVSRRLL